ncbi:predicted protein [Naegleria gruberi]|uniref:Predicted protein n=1 Tax=Naegleria gruberi TaxID=5762 RepID=D2VNR7_NAEGR|nr:uncharacterized protein NAEGRDRAFT_51067 [Naegleria gruberi]EFC41546.1 predicted protein [Naegleria gruberi]|eukprot:XP_002674290.1 predicted protein [Naegleria gruberi strain NEG-M]
MDKKRVPSLSISSVLEYSDDGYLMNSNNFLNVHSNNDCGKGDEEDASSYSSATSQASSLDADNTPPLLRVEINNKETNLNQTLNQSFESSNSEAANQTCYEDSSRGKFDGLLLCGSIYNTSREQQKRLEFIQQQQKSKQHSDNYMGKSATLLPTISLRDRLNYYKTIPFGEKIKKISCGSKHYMILTHGGRLFCSGWNDFGQLGIPKTITHRRGQNSDLNSSNDSIGSDSDVPDITPIHSPRVSSSPSTLSHIQSELEPHEDLELNFLREVHLTNLLPLVESIGKPMLPMRRPSRTISRNLNLKNLYNVKLVSCGDKHTMIVTQNGDVYSTGRNNDGQLGLGDFSDRFVFSKVNFYLNKDQHIDDIHCQFNNSAIITSKREVFVCGSNANAQLGLFLHKTKISVFTQIPLFNIPIKSISFNIDTAAILSMDGEIFSCGIGGDMNDAASVVDVSTMPEEKRSTMYRKNSIIPFFKKVPLNEKVDQLSSGIYFTLAISNSSKKIYIFHSNPNYSPSNLFQDLCSPRPFSADSHNDSPRSRTDIYSVGSLSSFKTHVTNPTFKFITFGDGESSKNSFKNLTCGYHHSVFVNYLDQFFACGKNEDGRLGFINGIQDNEYQNYLKRVKFPKEKVGELDFNSVACGESFTIFYNNSNVNKVDNQSMLSKSNVLIEPRSTRIQTKSGDLYIFKPLLNRFCPMTIHFLNLLDKMTVHFDISHVQFIINATINNDRFDSRFFNELSAKDIVKMLFTVSICVPFGYLINLKTTLLENLFEKVNSSNRFCNFYKKTIKELHSDEKPETKSKLPNLFKGTCRVYELTMMNEISHNEQISDPVEINKLFNIEESSDLKIQIGKTNLVLHKDVLSSYSETIRKQLSNSAHDDTKPLDIVKLCFKNEMSQGEKTLNCQALETTLKLMYDIWTCDLSSVIEGTNYLEFIFKLLDLSRILQYPKLFSKSIELIEARRNHFNDDDIIELVERSEDFLEMWCPDNHDEESTQPLTVCIVKILSDKFSALKRRLKLKSKWKGLESLIYEFIEDEIYYC